MRVGRAVEVETVAQIETVRAGLLSGMLSLAIHSEALTTNPVVGIVRIAGIERKIMRAASELPLDQMQTFLKAVRADEEFQRLDM